LLDWKFRFYCFNAALAILLHCATSSQGLAQSAIPSDPAATLRDTLFAACSQNSADFARALTVRNAQAFARLTPATRTTLLKRFVLLDKPGQPRSEIDASGNLEVFCATSDVTTLMQLAKPDVRDNLAFISLAIGNAAASSDDDSHRILIGLVREAGQWKLLSIGLLLLDLPSLGEEWDRAEIKTNEHSAIDSMKALADAIETYRKTYTHLPNSLTALGPPSQGPPKGENADLVTAELAAGRKDGYSFRYVIVGADTLGAPAKYELAAVPIEYGRTGSRSFFRDSSGVLHAADRHGAVGSDTDPKLDGAAAPD
jgi:hypothetical protein